MSQQQVQQRPSAANGLGRRRNDRDVANRLDSGFRSDSQSWRSSQPVKLTAVPTTTSHGHGQLQPTGSSQGHGHFQPTGNSHGHGQLQPTGSSQGHGQLQPTGSSHGHGQLQPTGSSTASNRASAEKDGGSVSGSRSGGSDADAHRVAFVHYCNCLIGQNVEVHLKNGRVYTGIFHAAQLNNGDFGVVLKFARMIKDATVKSGKGSAAVPARKPPIKTLVVCAEEFVQIVAKDVSVVGESTPNGRVRDNKHEMVTDSNLAAGKTKELERELKPWQPDEEAPRNLALDTTFQTPWNRNWDQFETNKALFGVETTFNEELYTTKLERGSHMREREKEAQRIAKEIEGTSTRNLHVAEERGARLTSELDGLDEESRFSSVLRGSENRDTGEDDEDRDIDGCNQETFGVSTGTYENSMSQPVAQESENRGSRPSSADSTQTSNGAANRDPLVSLRDRRTASIEKGEMAALDSLAETHREHLRLRHLLVGDNRKRVKGPGSPYHSGRASPLASTLVGDAAAIQALNLDPSCPQVSAEVIRDFQEFKLQESAKKGSKKQREDQVNELKSFSESLRTKKDGEPRSPRAQSRHSGDPGSRHASHESGARPSSFMDNKSGLGQSSSGGLSQGTSGTTAYAQPSQTGPTEGSTLSHASFGPTASKAATSSQTSISSATPTGLQPFGSGASTSTSLSGAIPAAHQPSNPSTTSSSGGQVSAGAVPAAVSAPVAHSVPAPLSIPNGSGSVVGSTTVSPASSASSASSGSSSSLKKSTLNPNAKEFKLNPNAKVFTPSSTFNSPRPPSPLMGAGQVYLQAGIPAVSPLPAMSVGVNLNQYMQQQGGQPAQYAQYGNGLGAGSGSYLQQPPTAYVPGVPGAGGPPVLPGQPSIKLPAHSQQQLYAQPLRYPPQGPPMQPGPTYIQPNGQLYPQQLMYSQPLVYFQYPQQGMIPGQPMQGQPVPPQGPLPPQQGPQQTQQQKHRGGGGGGMQGMHYTGAPPYLQGQPHHIAQSQQISHIHNSLQQPSQSGLSPAPLPGSQVSQGVSSGAGSAGQSVGNGGSATRAGGKGGSGSGSFQQQ